MINQFTNLIKKYYSKDLNQTFRLLDKVLADNSRSQNKYYNLRARHDTLLDQNINGAISQNEHTLLNNKLRLSLFLFLDTLRTRDMIVDEVRKILERHNITPLPLTPSPPDYKSLLNVSKRMIDDLIADYKRAIANNREDDDSYFNIGLCYLHLRLYDLSIKCFHKALELVPDEADYHYYVGLASIKGRRPMTLIHPEVKSIESYLNAAIVMNSKKAKYDLLMLILKIDYYQMNGLRIPYPGIDQTEKLILSKQRFPSEILRLRNSIIVKGNRLENTFNQLLNRK